MDEPASQLADAVDTALPGWVERSVARIASAYFGHVPEEVRRAAADAGEEARRDAGAMVRRLLEQDVDEQRVNPLALLRRAASYPTRVLQDAGVPPVRRDDFAERAFPDDIYDLSPATWRDVDDSLYEPGLLWGAWKAGEILRRRRAEGKR